jgi:hypothetical protein
MSQDKNHGHIGPVQWDLNPGIRTLRLLCLECRHEYELVLPDCVEAPNPVSVARPASFKRHVTEFVTDHNDRCVNEPRRNHDHFTE